ncbi:deleted in malignant brain tumors 1 protein-like isoform X3 [Pomacea canaliculata]|uniref:deleted in malignant brain tumors 1 protein-like isoform X3 n=1 Tax=Pomacea canaliculata TaxID=400727 RepID=UPI000D72BD59|nr:deleted in malignant brain tumors 1 protein-like isoform X3 [Pomacea canaliculata]
MMAFTAIALVASIVMFSQTSTTTADTTFDPPLLFEMTTSSILPPASTTVATSASTTTTATTSNQTFLSAMNTSSILTPASTTVATSVTTTEAATTYAIQFTQKFSSATITTSPSVCDVTNTTTLSAGEVRYLTSPNYPSDYDNNLDCWRLLIAPNGAVIKVTVLYAAFEQRYDYLNIYDGMSNSSNLLAGISGTLASPASYNSSGHYLLLHFHTDYNKVNSGFNLTYEVSLPQSASTSVTSTEAATTNSPKCRTITTTPSGYNSATGILTDNIILCVIASVFVAMMIQIGHNGSVL